MTQVTLLGAKRSKGVLDDGTSYDSTKLYLQMPMQKSDDTVGFAGVELNWGDSDNFPIIKNLSFPCEVDVTIELVTNGKTSKSVVTDLQPISKPKL